VTHSGEIGFVASALVFAAFGMKDMVNLRIVAICSNIAFIAYALVLNLPPILVLHIILLPLNSWRLAQELHARVLVGSPKIRGWKSGASSVGVTAVTSALRESPSVEAR
jgi:hypothetical protein